MWTKRRIIMDGDKTPRCKFFVSKGSGVRCDRPSRAYTAKKNGFDMGRVDCCINHKRKIEEQGFAMLLLDRRKRRAA